MSLVCLVYLTEERHIQKCLSFCPPRPLRVQHIKASPRQPDAAASFSLDEAEDARRRIARAKRATRSALAHPSGKLGDLAFEAGPVIDHSGNLNRVVQVAVWELNGGSSSRLLLGVTFAAGGFRISAFILSHAHFSHSLPVCGHRAVIMTGPPKIARINLLGPTERQFPRYSVYEKSLLYGQPLRQRGGGGRVCSESRGCAMRRRAESPRRFAERRRG